ncbi:A24 family peptidase [Providencia manganoxydans]|uniref:prepilin peptidase n=1 Tax=Providencia manganoxydans TaxID=2923283 RepID=UPI0034E4A262
MDSFLAWYYPILFLIIGACIGSFINVVIYRYPIIMLQDKNKPKKISLFYPASHCTSCNKKILKTDNIPIISWLLRKGECRHCGSTYSIKYLITEAVFSVVYLSVFILFYPQYGINSTICILVIFSYLYCIFFIDLKHFLIPDIMTIPLIILGFISAWYNFIPITIMESVIGSIVIFTIIFITGFLFKYFRGIDAIGFGDYKLFAVGGAWCGIFHIQYLIIFSSIFGIIFYIINKKANICSTKNISYLDDIIEIKDKVIPFGPSICLSIILNVLIIFYLPYKV